MYYGAASAGTTSATPSFAGFTSEASVATAAETGLSMQGAAYEVKFLERHLQGTAQSLNRLSKGQEFHVFNDMKTLSNVEAKIFSEGQYNGFVREYHRFSYRFTEPIGTRVQSARPNTPLFVGELKIRPNGFYHVIPRTHPTGQ